MLPQGTERVAAMTSACVRRLLGVALLVLASGNSVDVATAQGPVDTDRRADADRKGPPGEREFDRSRGERMWGDDRPSFGGDGPGRGGDAPFGGGSSPFGGGPPFGGDWRGGDRDRGSPPERDASPSKSRATTVKPLVPGFGVTATTTPPPGFGSALQLAKIDITDEDRREAERAFRYYDQNRDGKIGSDEMSRSRYGADLALYDQNRDGAITVSEMEYRAARQRTENLQANRNRSGPSDGQRRDDDRRGDRSRDGTSENSSPNTDADTKPADERKSYRRRSPTERLPEGLPDWFARDDADADGQVAMHEFSASWTDTVLAEYNQFDLNRDGLITPAECLKAKNDGAVVAAASAPPPSNSSPPASPSPPPASPAAAPTVTSLAAQPASGAASAAVATAPSGSPTATATSAPPPDVDPRSYEYFKKVVIKYDANNDGALTANEWASMSSSPEAADADHNGRVTIEEYARWKAQN